MENLIIIPARSGSSRIKNKNIKLLSGKPLIAYAIESALKAQIGRVIVSTDSKKIAEISKDFGAEIPFIRPKKIAQNTSTSLSVILHALNWIKDNKEPIPNLVMLRPPTNPFVKPETIRQMFLNLKKLKYANSLVSIVKSRTHPFKLVDYKKNGEVKNGIFKIRGNSINNYERSQDWPAMWEGSPACRLSRCKFFFQLIENSKTFENLSGKTYDNNNSKGHIINYKESLDIDVEIDFIIAESLSKVL